MLLRATQAILDYANPVHHTLWRFEKVHRGAVLVPSIHWEDFQGSDFLPIGSRSRWHLAIETDDIRWKRRGFEAYLGATDVWVYDMLWKQALQIPVRGEAQKIAMLAKESEYEIGRFIALVAASV